MEQKTHQKGKIYLLMGYLGSGKTTFIRNVLNNKKGKKYAIIQNQFATGQMGIEQPLIMDESGTPFSNFLQLPNGCICCSAKYLNDLVASIQYILSNTDVKNIIVQTNGLADPGQSIKQFWFDEEMKINGQLHSVISIFSVQKFKDLQNKELFQKQIIFANKALLTFVDKSSQQQVEKLEAYIKQNNKQCQIKKNNQYDVIEFLSGNDLFDVNNLSKETISLNAQNSQKHHHHGMNSLFFKGKCTLKEKDQVQMAIGQLLWQSGLKILRIKGVYSVQNSQNVIQLQGVDDLFQVKDSQTHKVKYNGQTKVLVIGQEIQGKTEQIKKFLKIQ